MSRDSTYGDHRTLQALADALLLNICVVTTEPGGFIIHINPAPEAVPLVESQSQREPVTIYLSLAAEHYGSVETCTYSRCCPSLTLTLPLTRCYPQPKSPCFKTPSHAPCQLPRSSPTMPSRTNRG